tara:strand:+ start:313 stop:450 length:138 start_codon:yes stop_codon:yes gene_type:complete
MKNKKKKKKNNDGNAFEKSAALIVRFIIFYPIPTIILIALWILFT